MSLRVALDFADNPRPHHTLAAPADTNGELYRALRVIAAAYRATHPAAGDKVRELVAKWRREADRLRAINAEMDPDGKTFRYAECLREENAAQAGALTSCARALEAALQHRGDSQEVGRG